MSHAHLETKPSWPFVGWPIHFADRRLGYVWLVDPDVLIFHATVTQGTAESATLLHDTVDAAWKLNRDAFTRAGGVALLVDARSLTSYTTEGRQRYAERVRTRPRGHVRRVVVVVPQDRLLRMAAEALGLIAQLAGGSSMEVLRDPKEALEMLGVIAPAPGDLSRLPLMVR
ncbi:MAG: hypothetical protein HOW73_48795 [Polyangiaceae bacterium]|nr:hypothetical protein [Polyangiaceae bacterium]